MATAVYWGGVPRVLFVRWRFAESEKAVKLHIRSLPPSAFDDIPVELRIRMNEPGPVIVDAAEPGQTREKITVPMTIGLYELRSIHFAPDPSTSLLLHELRPGS